MFATILFKIFVSLPKIKLYKIKMLPVVVYGYVTWALTLRDEDRRAMI
jgi:hypothetical protein